MLAEGGVDLSLVGVADGETELRVLSATSVKFTGLPETPSKTKLKQASKQERSRLEEAESDVGRGQKRETRRQKR